MYDIAENILFGEPRPLRYQPVIENHKLAIDVTIICRDEFGEETGETYSCIIEHGCRNCEFGALETNATPCTICYKKHTPEKPYVMWKFDKNYDPCDEYIY
jgi:hypothetical protein